MSKNDKRDVIFWCLVLLAFFLANGGTKLVLGPFIRPGTYADIFSNTLYYVDKNFFVTKTESDDDSSNKEAVSDQMEMKVLPSSSFDGAIAKPKAIQVCKKMLYYQENPRCMKKQQFLGSFLILIAGTLSGFIGGFVTGKKKYSY